MLPLCALERVSAWAVCAERSEGEDFTVGVYGAGGAALSTPTITCSPLD